MSKLKALLSAYACNPRATVTSYPGEAILGWNLALQISEFCDVWIITQSSNKEDIQTCGEKTIDQNIQFVYVGLPRFLSILGKNYFGVRIYYWLWQIKAYLIARKIARRIQFDIFHQITFSNDWMPSYIGAYSKLPFVWGPVGGGQKVPRNLRSLLPLNTRIIEASRSIFQWMWRHTYSRNRCVKRASAILVCNKETKEKFKTNKNKIYDFPVNGISKDDFPHCIEKKSKDNPFEILYAGRLDPIKGLVLGIRAFYKMASESPNVRLTIVGEGPDEKRIYELINKFDLNLKINFVPWLERQELLKFMQKCDLLLFPSMRDGGGAVVVEAMAGGLPVIVLDIGGPGFHIEKEWGIKISPKDPEFVVQKMAESLNLLYRDCKLREKLGNSARSRAIEIYQWENLGKTIKSIYFEVLDK